MAEALVIYWFLTVRYPPWYSRVEVFPERYTSQKVCLNVMDSRRVAFASPYDFYQCMQLPVGATSESDVSKRMLESLSDQLRQ